MLRVAARNAPLELTETAPPVRARRALMHGPSHQIFLHLVADIADDQRRARARAAHLVMETAREKDQPRLPVRHRVLGAGAFPGDKTRLAAMRTANLEREGSALTHAPTITRPWAMTRREPIPIAYGPPKRN